MGDRAGELTVQAVHLAREAALNADHPVWVAGSQSPVEDCYTPHAVPDEATLAVAHAEIAELLAAAGVDLILVETQNTIREAVAAARAASQTGLPVLVSFVCGSNARLLSGETLIDAATAVLPFQPAGILVNCLPVATVPAAIAELKTLLPDLPWGAYANAGCHDEQQGWIATPMQHPANYAAEAMKWRAAGAALIGGCCGTTPEHIRQIQVALSQD